MELKDFYVSEPSKYWTAPKDKHLELDIIDNPDQYSNYIGSYKLDGEWSRMIWDGENVVIQSRSISKETGEYGRKETKVPHLVEEFKKLPKNTVLLGELYLIGLENHSKDVGAILRCKDDKAIDRQKQEEKKIHFYCFDVLMWDGIDLTRKGFEERTSYFSKIYEYCSDKYIQYAQIKTMKQIASEYDDYLEKGGEGFVLVQKNSTYDPGTRTARKTIKLKKVTEEIELKVIETIEPEKEYTGEDKANWKFWINNPDETRTYVTKKFYYGWKNGVLVDMVRCGVRVCSGLTDEQAQWLATEEAQSLIAAGKVYALVQAMEIEKSSGSLRHPVLKRLIVKE